MKSNQPFILPFFTVFIFSSLLGITGVWAQSDNNGDRRVTGSYYISNATVIPEPGKILSNCDVIFKNGTVSEIGKKLSVPGDAEEIKGDSLFIYPGFIDMGSKNGVNSPDLPKKPKDFDPSNPPSELAGIHPYFSAANHYQPNNEGEDEWRNLGFTVAQKIPAGNGMLPGASALLIYGLPDNSNLLLEKGPLFFRFNTVGGVYPNTKLAVMAKWRDLFQNTLLYREHQMRYAINKSVGRLAIDPVLDALIPLTQNKESLLVATKSELEIRSALKMQEENNLSLILLGVNEGTELIPVLKSKEVGVVLRLELPEDKFSDSLDKSEQGADYDERVKRIRAAYKESLRLASKYEQAEIPFAFTTLDIKKDDFFSNIQLMIDNGLSKDGALAALTTHPAKLLGMEEVIGSIAPGKMANMVLMNDSLFSENAKVTMVISDGYLFDYTEKNKPEKEANQIWAFVTKTPVGQSKGNWEFTKKDNIWSGKVTYDNPEGKGRKTAPTKNLTITGKSISFSYDVAVNNTTMEVIVDGKINENKFEGSMEIKGYDQFTVKATKKDKPIKKP
jgi:hypothetical protein